jgi:DNA gyrase inhibitor GyrI
MQTNTSEQTSREITIEILHPMHVACFRVVSQNPEEEAGSYLEAWIDRQGINRPVRHFGFDVEVTHSEEQAGKRGYEVWVTVPAGVQPSEGVTIQEYCGGSYAAMTLVDPFIDPFSTIPNGWKQLHEWVIQSSQYRGGEHQWLEELINEGKDLKLYHPIVQAG